MPDTERWQLYKAQIERGDYHVEPDAVAKSLRRSLEAQRRRDRRAMWIILLIFGGMFGTALFLCTWALLLFAGSPDALTAAVQSGLLVCLVGIAVYCYVESKMRR